MFLINSFFTILLILSASSLAAPPTPTQSLAIIESTAALTSNDAANFNKAKQLLDSWKGGFIELDDAEKLLAPIARKHPKFLPAYVERARLSIMVSIAQKNPKVGLEKAYSLLQTALGLNQNYAKAYVLLGHVYINMGKLNDAEQALIKAESLGIKDPWLDLNWADLLIKKEKKEEAINRCLHVLGTETDNIKALSAALELITQTNKYEEKNGHEKMAIELLVKSKLSRKQIISLVERTLITDNRSQININKALIDRLIENDKKDPQAWILLGRYYQIAGYQYSLGMLQIVDERYSNASTNAYREALKYAQNDPDIYSFIAENFINQKHYQKAKKIFHEAKKNKVNGDNLSLEESRMKYLTGQTKEAISDFESYTKNRDYKISDKAYSLLRTAYEETNNIDAAEQLYRASLRTQPDNAWENGEYAKFLLTKRRDIDMSIYFSRKTLALKDYPIGRKILSASLYCKWADLYLSKREAESYIYLREAQALYPDINSVSSYFGGNAPAISKAINLMAQRPTH